MVDGFTLSLTGRDGLAVRTDDGQIVAIASRRLIPMATLIELLQSAPGYVAESDDSCQIELLPS